MKGYLTSKSMSLCHWRRQCWNNNKKVWLLLNYWCKKHRRGQDQWYYMCAYKINGALCYIAYVYIWKVRTDCNTHNNMFTTHTCFVHQDFTWRKNIYSRFFSYFEAFASKFLENLLAMFSPSYMHSHTCIYVVN